MRTARGFVSHVFDGSILGVWMSAACLIIGGTAIAAVIARSLLPAESVVAGLAILCYAAYRRVVYIPTYILIMLLAAAGATLLVPLSGQLTMFPIHRMTVVGLGPIQVPLVIGATVVNSSAATWALICGPIGLLVGIVMGVASILDKSSGSSGSSRSHHESAGIGIWLGVSA
jgi:hypothetical protein